jgi:hypothetical protein
VKVDRKAWVPGAVWETKTKNGHLEAIIVGPSRSGHKIVHMNYLTGRWKDRPVQQEYSHRHMLKYFKFAEYYKEIPEKPNE